MFIFAHHFRGVKASLFLALGRCINDVLHFSLSLSFFLSPCRIYLFLPRVLLFGLFGLTHLVNFDNLSTDFPSFRHPCFYPNAPTQLALKSPVSLSPSLCFSPCFSVSLSLSHSLSLSLSPSLTLSLSLFLYLSLFYLSLSPFFSLSFFFSDLHYHHQHHHV